MSSSTSSKLLAIAIGAAMSITWLGVIGMGFEIEAKPAMRTIELPTVVIVGNKTAAMNATAFGLITAIFSMICHSVFSNQAAHIAAEIDEFGVKLMDLVAARSFKHSSERTE